MVEAAAPAHTFHQAAQAMAELVVEVGAVLITDHLKCPATFLDC